MMLSCVQSIWEKSYPKFHLRANMEVNVRFVAKIIIVLTEFYSLSLQLYLISRPCF